MAVSKKRIWGWMAFDWASQPFYTLGLTFIFGPYFAVVATEYFFSTGMIRERGRRAGAMGLVGGPNRCGANDCVHCAVSGRIRRQFGPQDAVDRLFLGHLCRDHIHACGG